jgi:DNA-binding response OmpR family regulator
MPQNTIQASKILIVDDQSSNIMLLQEILENSGYVNIHTLLDSRKALETIEEISPDIILLDLMMPHVTGYDILKTLQENGKLTGTMPVVVLTADITSEARRKALHLGASDFITKPIDIVEVTIRIRNHLRLRRLLKQQTDYSANLEQEVLKRTREIQMNLELLKEKNETLKRITWMHSHAVRAPLARIMGLINLLDQTHYNASVETKEVLSKVLESANELDDCLKDMTAKISELEIEQESHPY